MPLQVMHAHKGLAVEHGQGFARRQPHQQRAHQPRRTGRRHRIQVIPPQAGLIEGLGDRRINQFHMLTRGHFGYHAPVGAMQIDLRCNNTT